MIITSAVAAAAVMGRYFKSACVHIGATFALVGRRRWWWVVSTRRVSACFPLIRAVFYTQETVLRVLEF